MCPDYRLKDENVKDYKKHQYIIDTIKQRFTSYGYKRIKTSAFEQYDLYSQVTSSINRKEMIKIIDYTGDVLVLRPDVTIPITKQLAQEIRHETEDIRYFYIQDVFRQPFERGDKIENTQAGIEYFGANHAAADAEVIALACQTLLDFGFSEMKVELGDAGFFQELVDLVCLSEYDQIELKKMIQAKNAADMKPFLDNLSIDRHLAHILEQIPFLYGDLPSVCARARALDLPSKLETKLDHLLEIYEILKVYELEDKVVLDLGLINHMGYYSAVIFQGFVDKVGEPVLMGGRYDKLAEELGVSLKAIGFACKVDELVTAIEKNWLPEEVENEVHIAYGLENLKEAVEVAKRLRETGFSATTHLNKENRSGFQNANLITIESDERYRLDYKSEVSFYSTIEALLSMMQGGT